MTNPYDTYRLLKSIARAAWTLAVSALIVALCVVMLGLMSCVGGQDRKHLDPLTACLYALQDANSLHESQRAWTRYIFIQDADQKERQYLLGALHAAPFRSARIQTVPGVAGGYLLRVNCYEGRLSLKAWEKLFGSPMFNSVNGGYVDKQISVSPWKASDGKTYTYKIERVPVGFGRGVLPHCQALSDLLVTQAPIVESGYFVLRALASVDLGMGAGLYYDFSEIRKSTGKDKDAGKSDLDLFYGLDRQKARDEFLVARAAISVSAISEKLRALEIQQGSAHPANSDGMIYGTFDIFDEDRGNAKRNIFRNLLGFIDNNDHRAGEFIRAQPNGFLTRFSLNNNKGERQDFVPQNIVKSTYIFTGLTCIECHGKDGGLKGFRNDVRDLKPNFDLTDKDSYERIQSEYFVGDENYSQTLFTSEQWHADAVFLATEGLSVPEWSAGVVGIATKYMQPVDAIRACELCGQDVANMQSALSLLSALDGTIDPDVQRLQHGQKLGFREFWTIYADILPVLNAPAPTTNPINQYGP